MASTVKSGAPGGTSVGTGNLALRLRGLHVGMFSPFNSEPARCQECGKTWPCPTLLLIEED